jgi:hypothetical protein
MEPVTGKAREGEGSLWDLWGLGGFGLFLWVRWQLWYYLSRVGTK